MRSTSARGTPLNGTHSLPEEGHLCAPESDCSGLTSQPHIDILHIIIRINRLQKRFHFFALGIIAECDGIFRTIA